MGVSSAPPPPLLRGICSWYLLLWRPVAFGEEERREGGEESEKEELTGKHVQET